MAEIRVSSEAIIAAPADLVYGYLSNYREHHPHILPPAFSDFRIDEGGIGAGTVISFQLTAGGRSRTSHMRVSEPVPGQVLKETDMNSSLATTFTVLPEGNSSRVQISTVWQGAGGIGGFFERLFAPRVLRKLYVDELQRLDRYAQEQQPS